MNNITSNSFKRYSYFPSSVPKTESKEAKKKRSSFYDELQAAKDLKLKDIPVEKVSLPYKGYKNISDLEWYN